MNLFRRIVVIADIAVLAGIALTMFGMARSHTYLSPISDESLFLVLILLLIANLVSLVGVTDSKAHNLIRLWLDAKERELRKRAEP